MRLLLQLGAYKVVATSASGNAGNLEDLLDRVEVATLDVGSFTDVSRTVQKYGPTTIYHVRALLAPSCDSSPEAGIRANAIGTEAGVDQSAFIVEFESLAKAIAAYESDLYRTALKVLGNAAQRDFRIVEGR